MNPTQFKEPVSRQSIMAVVGLLLLLLILSLKAAFGQTNPTAQALPFSQNFASFTGAITTYPAGFQGWTITGSLGATFPTAAPAANQALAGGTNATTVAGVYDMVSKAGMVSTGSNLRTLALAINTTSHTYVAVSYTMATQAQISAGRINEMTLQYRVGTSGVFTTVAGTTYQNNATSTINTGTAASNPATVVAYLPVAAENQANVQLRWVMRDISGTGTRPTFSIDDISITADVPPVVINLNTISPSTLTEGTGPWTLQATAASAVPGATTINIAITGPASGELTANDYTLASSTITISSGGTNSTTTTLSIANDTRCEGNESITVTLTTSSFGVAIGTSTQTLTIADDASDLFFPLNTLNVAEPTITFNSLANSGLSPDLDPGLYILEQGVNANKTYASDVGGTTTGNIYSYGASLSTERALGSLGTGSMGSPTGGDQTLGIFYGYKLKNNTGSAINGLTVDYFGELWTKQGSLVDEVKFQYSLDATSISTGTWTTVNALTMTPSVDLAGYAGIGTGAVNGDLPANRFQKTASFVFGSNLANNGTVWIRWFDYNSVANDDGYGIDDLTLTPLLVASSQYYSKSAGALNDLTTWGTNANGTGTNPPSFSFPGLILNVRNQATATINANWTVSGISSKVVVNNGSNFVIPAGLSLNGTVDVNNGGTLTLNNPASVPSFGSLAANGTVAFSALTAQSIPSGTYGNLLVSNAGTKTFSALPIIILGDLTLNNVVTDYGAGSFTIGGNIAYIGAVNHLVSTNSNSFILNGSGMQTISGNGNLLRCYNFVSTKTQGGITLSPGTSIDARNSFQLNFSGTSGFVDGGNSLTARNNAEFDGSSANYNLTGTFTLNFDQASGGSNLRNNSTDNKAAVAQFYNLVLLNNGTGTATDINIRGQNSRGPLIKSNLTFGGSSTLGGITQPNGAYLQIGGSFINNRVESTLQSTLNGKVEFFGGGTANITTQTTGGTKVQRFDTLIISRPNATLTIDGDLTLDGGLVGTAGSGNHIVSTPGGVFFTGSSSSNIFQGSFTIDRVNSSNSSVNGVLFQSGAILNVTDALSFGANGKINTTAGTLRLVSNATKTARIDVAPTGASIIGSVVSERYIPASGWHFLGTSMPGQTIADWNDDIATQGPMPGVSTPNPGSNTSTIFLYNQAGTLNDQYAQVNGWEVPTTSSLDQNKGYRVYTSGGKTLDNVGVVTFGTKTLSLDWSGSTAYKGYNLVVNPHLSAIDWTHASVVKNNVANTVIAYNPSAGTYQYFGSPIGSVPLNSGLNPIASGQGFMVKAIASPASVDFPEASKVSASGTFLRTATDQSNRVLIRLKNSNLQSDEALFKFVEGYSAEFDAETDALKLENAGLNVYTLTPLSNQMAINALSYEGEEMIIPIGLNGPAGNYHLSFEGTEELHVSSQAFLRDNQTGTLHDLFSSPDYQFHLTQGGSLNNRFELIFTTLAPTSLSGVGEDFSFRIFPNPTVSGCLQVWMEKPEGNIGIEVLDVVGKTAFFKKISNPSQIMRISLPAGMQSGHYLVRVTSPKGTSTKQLTVH